MNVALTVEDGRVAPCFAGVELWIIGPNQRIEDRETVKTTESHPLSWARELVRRDIGVFFCSGIDMFAWGFLKGNGVQIVPECFGTVESVLEAWRNGSLMIPSSMPMRSGQHAGQPVRNRRRYRGRSR